MGAVAVIIAPDPDAILLIRRAGASPGRSGIDLLAEQLLGSLDDVVPRNPVLPPIAVRPFAFLLPARPALVLNPEVAATRWVTPDDLLQPGGGYHMASLEVAGQKRQVQAYRLEGAIVWGMTERILTDLLDHLRD